MQGKYFSFGATSAVITGLAVIIGLSRTANPVIGTTTALVVIAIADNISDSFGIHIHQESQKESVKEVRKTTFTNFVTRVAVVSVFVLLVILLPVKAAVVLSIFFGMAVISIISYFIAKEQKAKPHRIVFQHLLITVLVMIGSYLLREASAGLIAKFS
jgi:predicted neutral ceramidase superfamily lipid hydrolase